ncbi:MAG: hypothetical protein E7668_02765 [Ruminococcaceae bacterium]|nr:hypothetical protein [Oscillospiraceae bacterium]
MTNKDLDQYISTNNGYSQQKKLMDQQRAAANRNLEVQKKQEQQAAAIQHQKLMKYLPEYQKSMGLKGNGMSETALLDANARYRSEQGRIHSEYSSRQDAVNEQYRQNLLDLYARAGAEQEQDREELYNKAKDAITNWQGSSEELTKYVDSLAGQLDDNDYAILKDVYTGVNKAIIQANNDKEKEDAILAIQTDDLGGKEISNSIPTEYSNGKNFVIKFDGKPYKVQIDTEVSDKNAKIAATNSNISEGEVFVYDGKLYLKGPNDAIYSIESRFWDSGTTNDYYNLASKFKKKENTPTTTDREGDFSVGTQNFPTSL